MALNLHKYENQAKLSVALAIVSGVTVLMALGLIVRNFNATDMYVYYGGGGMYLPVLGGLLGMALLTGAGGFFAGIGSAGQRRNKAANLSWAGFFLSAATITIALCAGAFFYFTRNAIG